MPPQSGDPGHNSSRYINGVIYIARSVSCFFAGEESVGGGIFGQQFWAWGSRHTVRTEYASNWAINELNENYYSELDNENN